MVPSTAWAGAEGARCVVSEGGGIRLSVHSGRPYGTDTSRQGQNHARRSSRDTAIESVDQRARRAVTAIKPKTVTKWKKRALVHDAAIGPKGTALDGAQRRRGGPGPLRSASTRYCRSMIASTASGDDPASHPIVAAPCASNATGISRLPELAGDDQAANYVQELSHRRLPYRHCRSSYRRRQTPSVRCHRPHFEVCVSSAPWASEPEHRNRISEGPDRGRSLHDPHGSH